MEDDGTGGASAGGAAGAGAPVEMIEVRDQDRHLPIANIARIMKKSLPENAKVSKVI